MTFRISNPNKQGISTLSKAFDSVATITFSEALISLSECKKFYALIGNAIEIDNVKPFGDEKGYKFTPQLVMIKLNLEDFTTTFNGKETEQKTSDFQKWLGNFLHEKFGDKVFAGSISFNTLSKPNLVKLLTHKDESGKDVESAHYDFLLENVISVSEVDNPVILKDFKLPKLNSSGGGNSGGNARLSPTEKLEIVKEMLGTGNFLESVMYLTESPTALELLKILF